MKLCWKKPLIGGTVAGAMLFAGGAWATPATPWNGGGDLQGVFDNFTVGGSSSVDVTTDNLSDVDDTHWAITGTGGSISTMIVEMAGFNENNIFGFYDSSDPTTRATIFGGSDAPGSTNGGQKSVAINLSGDVLVNGTAVANFAGNSFGFFLDSTANAATGGGLFFSDTSLNSDAEDHLVMYQGQNTDTIQLADFQPGLWTNNEYILAWEDLIGPQGNARPGQSDRDFTDMVLSIESISPVPVPAAVWLMGSALVLLVGVGRRGRRGARTAAA